MPLIKLVFAFIFDERSQDDTTSVAAAVRKYCNR